MSSEAIVKAGLAAPKRRRCSDVITDIIEDTTRERISMGELAHALEDRAFGAVITLCGAPNIVGGAVPGISLITSMPIFFVAIQLLWGRREIYMPKRVAAKTLPRADLGRHLGRVLPWIRWVERWIKPRYTFMSTGLAERFIGLICLMMVGILFVPLPFSNGPPGLAMTILGLGLIERDGIVIALGILASIGAFLIFYLLTFGVLVFMWSTVNGWIGL